MSERIQAGESEAAAPPADPEAPVIPEQPAAAVPTAAARTVRAKRPWLGSLSAGFWVWLTGLLVYGLTTAVSWLPYEGIQDKAGPAPGTLHGLLNAWFRWDSVWYVIIADSGYEYDPRATAFFPLYPMLVRGMKPVTADNTFGAAMVVSALCALAALVVVHRLTAEMLGPAHAQRTTYYLLAFPTGFYLIAAYNESLFIALSVASLYCMRRGHWWVAGLLAGFASATRMAGVMLAAAFAYEYLRQRGWRWRDIRLNALAVGLVPAGLGAFMLYCYRTFGDPLHFLESQKAWFRYGFTPPWTTVLDVIGLINRTEPFFGPTNIRNIINLSTALVFLALIVLALVGPWKLGRDHAFLAVFAAAIVLMPLSNPISSDYPLSSMWRYVLECTVAFMVLARMGADRAFDRGYLITGVALQGAMIVTYVHDQFVA